MPRSTIRRVEFVVAVVAAYFTLGAHGAFAPPDFTTVLNKARPTAACGHAAGLGTTPCKGHVPPEWKNRNTGAAQEALAQWALELPFGTPSSPTPRAPSQTLTVAAIADAGNYWVGDLSQPQSDSRGFVAARFTADMTEPPDQMFGVGKIPKHRFRREFYLVIDDFNPDKLNYKRKSFAVSTWRVYGIDSVIIGGKWKERFVRVNSGKKGEFRLCGVPHQTTPGKVYIAQFQSCVGDSTIKAIMLRYPRYAAQLSPDSLFRAVYSQPIPSRAPNDKRLIDSVAFRQLVVSRVATYMRTRSITLDPQPLNELTQTLFLAREEPAWKPCGLGCCTSGT